MQKEKMELEIRTWEAILLDKYADDQSRRKAINGLYRAVQSGLKLSDHLSPERPGAILNSLLELVNGDDHQVSNRERIQACRLLSSILGERSNGNAWKRWGIPFDHVEDSQDDEQGVVDYEEYHGLIIQKEEEEQKKVKKSPKRKRRPKRRPLLKPKSPREAQQQQDISRISSSPNLRGILIGSEGKNIRDQSTSDRKRGYQIPMMWFPEGMKMRKSNNNNNNDEVKKRLLSSRNLEERLPPIDSPKKRSPRRKKRQDKPISPTNTTKNNNLDDDLDQYNDDELEKILHQENRIYERLEHDIKMNRLQLPTQFLLEQGLEVAYSREVARKVLERLFAFAGRGPLQHGFNIWREFTLVERFKEFVKYANAEKARKVIEKLIQGKLLLGFEKWVDFLEYSRYQELLKVTIAVQTHRRGVLARRYFEIHKQRWYASRKIQTFYRWKTERQRFQRMRYLTIFVQKYERKWQVQRRLKLWHASAILISKYERMRFQRWSFLELKRATLMIQANYRGVLGRVRFKMLMAKHMGRFELEWASASMIQSFFMRIQARNTIRETFLAEQRVQNAALKIQLAWYIFKDQFPAFILMRSYLIQDEADKALVVHEKRMKTRSKAVQIQCFIRCVHAKRLYARMHEEFVASRRIQALCRSFVARQKVKRFRVIWNRILLIQRTFRAYIEPIHHAARVIQCHFIKKDANGRLLRKRDAKLALQERKLRFKLEYYAANTIQCFIRSSKGKWVVKRLRGILMIQRVVRGFLGRLKAKRLYQRVCDNVVDAYVSSLLISAHESGSKKEFTRRMVSSGKIQSWYRFHVKRYNQKVLQKYIAKRNRNAKRIQKRYRGYRCRKMFKEMKALDHRVRTNRYRSINSPLEVAENAVKHARAFYDPADELAGMHPIIWLHRLGLGKYWPAFHKGPFKIADTSKLLTLQTKALKQTGVDQPEDVELISRMQIFTQKDPMERDQNLVRQFSYIRTMDKLKALYMEYFPEEQETRMENFLRKFQAETLVTEFQLRKHFNEFRERPKMAREYAEERLFKIPDQQLVDKWTKRRYKQCFAIYEMALETISKRQITDDLKIVISASLRRANRPGVKSTQHGCNELRVALNLVIKLVHAAKSVQRAVRGKLARAFFHAALARKRYKEQVLQGGAVKDKWRLQQEKEAREWEEYCKAYERYEVEQVLAQITRYGYTEVWDDYSMQYYYIWERDHLVTTWERPVYTYEENRAALTLQKNFRACLARQLLSRLKIEEQEKLQLMRDQKEWESKHAERLNFFTFKIHLHEISNEAHDVAKFDMGAPLSWRRQRMIQTPNSKSRKRRDSILFKERWKNNKSQARRRARASEPRDWFETKQMIEDEIEKTREELGKINVVLERKRQELETMKQKQQRGRQFVNVNDPYFFLTKTGKNSSFHSSTFTGGSHESEGLAMGMEDKYFLDQISKPNSELNQMMEEDRLSRERQETEFIETRLGHFYHYKPMKPGDNAYDWKVKTRKEIACFTRISAVVRGYLVRRERNKDKILSKIHKLEQLEQETHKSVIALEGRLSGLYIAAKVSHEFTFVELPFGWYQEKDGYGRVYFCNHFTREALWQRPSYVWTEELAARSITRVVRGFLGRRQFLRTLLSDGIPDLVRQAVTRAGKLAYFGYGVEGLSVQMWFARRGLYHIIKDTLESKPNSVKALMRGFTNPVSNYQPPWTVESLRLIGITDKSNVETVLAYQEHHGENDGDEDHNLLFQRESTGAQELFLHHYPNQAARASKFSQQATLLSDTPITMRQLQMHLNKYRGKPSLATVQLQNEVFNVPTSSTPEEEEEAYYAMLGACKRIMIILSNFKIYLLVEKLQRRCQQASHILSLAHMHNHSIDKDEYFSSMEQSGVFKALEEEENEVVVLDRDSEVAAMQMEELKPPPGPWLCRRKWPIQAAAAYMIRENLELVMKWEKMATRIQRKYRSYYALNQWRQAAAWYREKVTIIQCAWRQYAARRILDFRYAQYHSDWEELYDATEDLYYYFDNRYQISQWEAPFEPYKPFGWWPPHPDDIPVPEGLCYICKTEEAIRKCNDCVTKNGDRREFCFECFAQVHDFGGVEFTKHTFTTVELQSPQESKFGGGISSSGGVKCGQCSGPSLRKCEECADFYCLSCYRRLHTRGKRKEHNWIAYKPSAQACVECEHDIARVHCTDCDDVYCHPCFAKLHKKGRRKGHTTKELDDPVQKTGKGR